MGQNKSKTAPQQVQAVKEVTNAEEERELQEATEFETAISATGYGLFNCIIILMMLFAAMVIFFGTTVMSFVLPVATCQLNLTLSDKGMLNSFAYGGMTLGALPWALISDRYGRKIVLIVAHFLDFGFNFACGFSQNKESLYAFKFLSGSCIVGSFAATVTYLSEVHARKHRMRVLILTGIMINSASLILPGLAALVLPTSMDVEFAGIELHSWNFFIIICAFPSLFAGIGFIFLPESPKYNMHKGRNSKAFKTFAFMYHLNKLKPKSEYPIEAPPDTQHITVRRNFKTFLADVWTQIKPIFQKRNILWALNVCFMDMCVLMTQNTIRLWMPNVFSSMEHMINRGVIVDKFCDILQLKNLDPHTQASCEVNTRQYLYNLPMAGASFIAFIIAFLLVQKVGGKIVLYIFSIFMGANTGTSLILSCVVIPFLLLASNPAGIISVISIYLALENISSTAIVSACVLLFPTQIRNTVLSVAWTFGRIGSVIGNNVMAAFLQHELCVAVIIWVGCVGVVAVILGLILPNPSKMPFK